MPDTPVKIEITDAEIHGQGGDITGATIKGDAKLTEPPDVGDAHPEHPINLPPTSDNPEVFFILAYCPNPPPPHWEWIAMSPGEPPERPHPQPPPEEQPLFTKSIVWTEDKGWQVIFIPNFNIPTPSGSRRRK